MAQKAIKTITIGADPEIFVRDYGKNTYISAHDLVNGTKNNPEKWEKGAIQADGVAVEFNIIPAKNARDFVTNVVENLDYIKKLLNEKNDQYKVAIQPTATFDAKYFETLPKYAKALGCEPDYNAYTGEINPKPKSDKPFRTGAGHLHIGWLEEGFIEDPLEPDHLEMCTELVQQLDVALFLPSLLFDKDTERRKLYGNPGSFRPKTYGVEYRPLSNRWLRGTNLMAWVFNTTLRATKDLLANKHYNRTVGEEIFDKALKLAGSNALNRYIRDLEKQYPDMISLPRGY